jgi:hypothetical protein
VEYIISSRGRPIGTTELGFVRFDGSSRSGWFHPNSLGESLMPDVAMVLPAVRAFLFRHERDSGDRSLLHPDFRRSSLFADLAEAFHRVAALDLTLHHADGTLIPTSMLGIQDTHQLLELGKSDPYPSSDPLIAEEAAYEEFDHELWDDPDLDPSPASLGWQEYDADFDGDFDSADESGWAPDEEPNRFPRYQVHALLVDESAIP